MKWNIFLSVLMAFPIFAGCAWRTTQGDHVFGPTLYRFNRSLSGNSTAFQTVHVPLLLEGGRQWGMSVGGVQRFALVARKPHRIVTPWEEQPRGLLIHPQPDRWQLSFIYLRAPLQEPPVFIRRSVMGAHGGAGAEQRAVSLGYSSITATTPSEDAVYELDFDSRHPLDATLLVTPAVKPEPSTKNPVTKEQP